MLQLEVGRVCQPGNLSRMTTSVCGVTVVEISGLGGGRVDSAIELLFLQQGAVLQNTI